MEIKIAPKLIYGYIFDIVKVCHSSNESPMIWIDLRQNGLFCKSVNRLVLNTPKLTQFLLISKMGQLYINTSKIPK